MPKSLKNVLSLVLGIPAFMIFCSEADVKYVGIQLLAGGILLAILVWNGMTVFKIGRN